VSTTSLTKLAAVVKVKLASTAPLDASTTRPSPPDPPATNNRPRPSTFRPSDGVPGPWLNTRPSPVTRLAR
jgi:hypothetical protein